MLIAELSRRTGLSRDTIRFYERIGLLDPAAVTRRGNGYKDYPPVVLQRLLAIQGLKALGFTLKEAGAVIARYVADPTSCPQNAPRLRTMLLSVDRQLRRLRGVKRRLQAVLTDCCPGTCSGRCGLEQELQKLVAGPRRD